MTKKNHLRDFKKFVPALMRHGFSHSQWASLTRVSLNTVSNWANGHARIPGLVWLLIDLMDERPELRDLIRGLAK